MAEIYWSETSVSYAHFAKRTLAEAEAIVCISVFFVSIFRSTTPSFRDIAVRSTHCHAYNILRNYGVFRNVLYGDHVCVVLYTVSKTSATSIMECVGLLQRTDNTGITIIYVRSSSKQYFL